MDSQLSEKSILDNYFEKKYGNKEKTIKFDSYTFTTTFNNLKEKLSEKLKNEKLNPQELETVKEEFKQIQLYLQENSTSLSPFEIQKCTSLMKEFRLKIDSFSQKNTKFSFSKRKVNESTPKIIPKEKEEIQEEKSNKREFTFVDESLLLKELTEDEDFMIKDSKNSKIQIERIVGAIYLKNLQDCEVSCGPVSGSIFIQNCFNCKFQLACKQVRKKFKLKLEQLRIHESQDCEFRVFCRNSSIIEKSKNLKFGEYSFEYPNRKEDFEKVEFFENNWKKIQDFDQPTKIKSSNWDFI
jgi:tubulin-specific chaperone C